MDNIQIFKDNLSNDEIVFITNENGSTFSMLKSVYDEQRANQAKGTIS